MGWSPLELLGDAVLVKLSDAVGIDIVQVRYVSALLLCVPLAALMRPMHRLRVPAAARHVYALLAGLQVMWFLYGVDTWHSCVSAVGVWLVMRLAPPRHAHKIGVAWSMAYVFLAHVYKMAVDYMSWSPDWTAPQMVVSIKMTAYCFAVHDHYRETALGEKLSDRQRRYAVRKQPSLLEFLGWTYFFPGFLGGPAVEYADYARYVDGSMFDDAACKGRIPGGSLRVLLLTLQSAFFMGCVAVLGKYGSENVRRLVVDPAEAHKRSVFVNLLLMYVACIVQRCKYYLVWTMGEAACVSSGVGYSGVDPKTKAVSWERAVNCKPLLTEFASSVKVGIDSWNIATERWLRHYVYERLEGTPLHEWRKAATFTTSAFWHGLYPGYYFTFISASVHVYAAGLARRKFRPRILAIPAKYHAKELYDVVTTLLTMVSLTYCMTCFMMLTAKDAWGLWYNTYFIGHAIPFMGLFFLRFVPTPRPAPAATTAEEKKTH